MTSSGFTRWGLPLALIGAALLLSAFVFYVKLPEPARILDGRTLAALLGAPGVALLVLSMLRGAARATGTADRGADLVIIWVVTFLFAVHAMVLGVAIGLVPSLRLVIPHGVALLLLGLGPAIGTLPPGSALGIRTSSTLSDDVLWRKTHLLAGWMLGVAGLIGMVGAQIGGRWALVAGIGPAVIAMIVALLYGSQSASVASDEQTAPDGRPPLEAPVVQTVDSPSPEAVDATDA